MNVTIGKLTSDKLKKQVQGKGGTYDGSYGGADPKDTDPNKVIIGSNSYKQAPGTDETLATSVEEPNEHLPEPAKLEDEPRFTKKEWQAKMEEEKKLEEENPELEHKMEEEDKLKKEEQGTTGTYDGSYGVGGGEIETPSPVMPSTKLFNADLKKMSLDTIFNRQKPGPSQRTLAMRDSVSNMFKNVAMTYADTMESRVAGVKEQLQPTSKPKVADIGPTELKMELPNFAK